MATRVAEASALGFGRLSISQFLWGVQTTAFVLAGLGVALCTGRAYKRWAVGAAIVMAFMAAQIFATRANAAYWLAGVAGVLWLWASWLVVGFVLRSFGYGLFARQPSRLDRLRSHAADLLLLTAAIAGALGASNALYVSLESDPAAQVIEVDPTSELFILVLLATLETVPLLPVLLAAFRRGEPSPKLLVVSAFLSFVLLCIADAARLLLVGALYNSAQLRTLVWSHAPIANAAYHLGQVLGLIGMASSLSWAGYRVRRASDGPPARAH
ncbi:hypothetical protein [Botrimarina sp.]|uniref:hypothetical protein n=1 Tax=Botrimarina sp. TaxID=2795802 RepID=UPI0032EE17B7